MDAFCSCAPVPGPGYWLAGLISTAKQKWTCTFHATTSCISAVTQICETFIQRLFFSTVYGMCFPLNPLKPRQEIVCFWYITDNWMFATALKIIFNYNYHSQQVLLLVISSVTSQAAGWGAPSRLTCSEKRWFTWSENSCISPSSPLEWQLGLGTSIPWLSKMAASSCVRQGREGNTGNIKMYILHKSRQTCDSSCRYSPEKFKFLHFLAALIIVPLWWTHLLLEWTILKPMACHQAQNKLIKMWCFADTWTETNDQVLTNVRSSLHLLPTVGKPVVHLQCRHTLKLRQFTTWGRTRTASYL